MEILEPQYGAKHKMYPDYFWNGYEWQEEAHNGNFFDFNLGRDWTLLLTVAIMVVMGVSLLIAVK